jgi:LmbE family N-acetylglucosaminyl deacetylase
MPALVISPHLDDAVLACGCLLAVHPDSTVVTVFAGAPRDASRLTPWDARCGFSSAEQAMAVRRQEDQAALAALDAAPRWLEFCDSQYGQTPPAQALQEALRRVIDELRPSLLLFPLGLFHSDHLLVHEAVRLALVALPSVRALAYEDALYRGMRGVLQQRLAGLAAAGRCATPARLDAENAGAAPRKAQAIGAYASQLRAFGPGGIDDAAQPERFWTIEDAELPHA